jgi:hypothetical protein
MKEGKGLINWHIHWISKVLICIGRIFRQYDLGCNRKGSVNEKGKP